ncbi:selenoprotein Pb-like [Hyla sarda]|uniref:selenoprotein Pb-like n=1 Tax=Hyla sarda TaxID=327740 RepID=UPI0024C29200|nr:selenoprotein Pb-like [Hyla sarda]
MMRGPCLVIVSLLGLLVVVSSARNETSICKPPPHWSIGDEEPMARSVGQVTVVALLQASCGFCLVQATNMGPLRDKLADRGLTNISYIIVNDQSFASKLLFPVLQSRAPAGMSVYQQLPNQEDVWEILDGSKDDFLIYDRCGRLTFHIRLPLSYLHFPYVEAAINATYYEDYCQNCTFYANVTENKKNETLGSPITDIGKEKQSKPGSLCPEEHTKKKPGDQCKNEHSQEDKGKNNRDHQPKEEERHQPINNDGERHQPINNDGERHQPINNDGERHQPINNDGERHHPIKNKGKHN